MSAAARLLWTCALTFATFVACADSIVGTWKLVSYEDRTEGEPPKYPFGAQPRGLLIYDATGHMSIQLMKTPHPEVASGDDEK